MNLCLFFEGTGRGVADPASVEVGEYPILTASGGILSAPSSITVTGLEGLSARKLVSVSVRANGLLSVDVVVERVNKLLKGWGGFYSVGYPARAFRKVNHYVLKRMARFLNRKSQRYYRLKFADTYYGEMTHYGLHRLAWADVRRTRN